MTGSRPPIGWVHYLRRMLLSVCLTLVATVAVGAPPLERTATLQGEWSELTLQPSATGPQFGASLAADQSWLAVGAPDLNILTQDLMTHTIGAVFLFRYSQGQWQRVTRLMPPSNSLDSRCGASVALKIPYLAVGCPGGSDPEGSPTADGMVVIYRWIGHQSWTIDQVIAPGTVTHCGTAVDLSAPDPLNGSVVLAIGCPGWTSQVGQARVWRLDATLNEWQHQATLTGSVAETDRAFGSQISLYRARLGPVIVQRLAVGGRMFQNGKGMLAVFEGGSWTETVLWAGGAPGEHFGDGLVMLGSQLLIAAPGSPGGEDCADQPLLHCGRVHRARREAGEWSLHSSGEPININGNPSGIQPMSEFGSALAVGMGNLVAIGAPGTDGWSVSVPPGLAEDVGTVELRRAPDGMLGLTDQDYVGEIQPGAIFPGNALTQGRFGQALAFGPDYLAVGYPGAGHPDTGREGAVWIYRLGDQLFADRFEP